MNNGYYEKAFWLSKKWQSMVLGIVCVFAVYVFNLPKEMLLVLAPIVGYQLAQGMSDFGKENKARTEVVSNLEEEIDDQAETINMLIELKDQKSAEVLSIASETVVAKDKGNDAMTPERWEREYLAYFEERINYQKGKLAMYPDKRFRFDELLAAAEHSLVVAKASVASVKLWQKTGGKAGSEPNSLGDIGYRILGIPVPWEK